MEMSQVRAESSVNCWVHTGFRGARDGSAWCAKTDVESVTHATLGVHEGRGGAHSADSLTKPSVKQPPPRCPPAMFPRQPFVKRGSWTGGVCRAGTAARETSREHKRGPAAGGRWTSGPLVVVGYLSGAQ